MHFHDWNILYFIDSNFTQFVSKGAIDNNPALVQVMAWRLFGAKPLTEPMLIQFTDAYIRH